MKRIVLFFATIITYVFILNVDICKSQWVYQYTASQYVLFNKIQFPTESIGYAVGESTNPPHSVFIKTTNAGINWINMNITLSYDTDIIEMSFINANTGYICGRYRYIFKTTNGGANWDSIQTPYFGNQIWNSMQFLDENTGYLAGRYGLSEKTTNGGINWTSLDTALGSIYDIYFLNALTGFMGDEKSYLKKTTNGGINWSTTYLMDTLGATYSLQKIDFANSNTGYVVGLTTVKGAIFKTTNNGNTWKNILITQYPLYCIKATNNANLYAAGVPNIVLYSSNTGNTWSSQVVPTTTGTINSICFTNSTTGYLTVANEIYKTTNGGVGIINISTEIPNEFKLFQNYPNPFNSSTKIKFQINKKDRVKILLYNIKGAEISPMGGLVNEYLEPGVYEFLFNSDKLTSGLYFCKLVTNNYSETIKLMIIK